jgi:hypothetical protein
MAVQLHAMASNTIKYELCVIWFQRSLIHKILLCYTVYKIVKVPKEEFEDTNGVIKILTG